MPAKNKHGLSRHIPSRIRRSIRKRCGFGCVVCGAGIYDYEHIDPEFKDAIKHDPDHMTLLCPQCNQKKRRGHLSSETVRTASQNPACLASGFSNESFDLGPDALGIHVAGVVFSEVTHLIVVSGSPMLSINDPEANRAPYRISGVFCDKDGKRTLEISDNWWKAKSDNWDVEWNGPKITIRRGRSDIALKLKVEPPKRLIVESLNMFFNGVYICGGSDQLRFSYNGVDWSHLSAVGIRGAKFGIII